MTSRLAPFRLSLVDMNNGVKNEAIRCFRRIIDAFFSRVRRANPELETILEHVQPRNLGEQPSRETDLCVSTGGPGSPFDGYEDRWCTEYRRFLDAIVERAIKDGDRTPSALVICHSFEIAIEHFGFARMARRPERKFGLMPVYMTEAGMRSPLLGAFGDRLFAWEHREWQAVDLDHGKLARTGGELWARESRDGASKGEGLLAFRFAPGLEGTQFHPEADRDGALAWILRPEQAAACISAYGEVTYKRMLKSLDDPTRLLRTFEQLIPGWLDRRFDALAPARGWAAIGSDAAVS